MTQQIKHIKKKLLESGISSSLLEGVFGIEKENVRVMKNGELAVSPHPDKLGDKNIHPYITTDFSESQIEMITPPLHSINEAHGFLETVHDLVSENIGDEYLWPQSLPPIISENVEIPIAKYGKGGKDKETYREMLARIYGKERQLISGMHYNFSFTNDLLYKIKSSLTDKSDFEDFKEAIYFKLSRNVLRYRWLLIWLFGASPETEKNYKVKSLINGTHEGIYCKNGVSLRNCKSGYRNKEDYFIDFRDTKNYRASIKELVKQGKLKFDKELYAPVRVKFNDDESISHIELRIMDLNPLEKTGVSKRDMHFVHLFLLYCLLKEEANDFGCNEQQIANSNQDTISCCGRYDDLSIHKFDGSEIIPQLWAKELLIEMESIANEFELLESKDYKNAFDAAMILSENPKNRVVFEVMKRNNEFGFVRSNLELARDFKKESSAKAYRFYGLEDMELSTQLILKEAVLRGLQIEILDRKKNFISLANDSKKEYLIQATKTSIDNYSSILLMEDKQITKKILEEHQINAPKGRMYDNTKIAINDFSIYKNKAIVVKPNSTNFGIGLTILKENNDELLFKKAVEMAFENDENVLIEHFFSGDEYRFFVIGDEVVGILKRVPANVKGDGKSSIRELAKVKNQDPIRGKGYRTPLEKINLGDAEEMFLKTQGLDFESIPKKDQIIYLRENSNISTGGDSIDFTDEVHQSYKDIAVAATKALNVKITGLDMMLREISSPATTDNYTIIELNFNPAIHIHCYPFIGKNRPLNKKILDALSL